MNEFMINITLGNDAMSDAYDVAAALAVVAARLEMGSTSGTVRDINGNNVGSWSIR